MQTNARPPRTPSVGPEPLALCGSQDCTPLVAPQVSQQRASRQAPWAMGLSPGGRTFSRTECPGGELVQPLSFSRRLNAGG